MSNLLEVYDRVSRPRLEKALRRAESLDDAGRLVREALEQLLDPRSDFLGELTLHQAEVARRLLDHVYRSARLLQTVVSVEPVDPPTGHGRSRGLNGVIRPVAAGILGAVAAPALPWVLSPVIGAAAGVGSAFILRQPDHGSDAGGWCVRIDHDAILRWLRESLDSADWILEATVLKPPPPPKTLDAFADVIGLFQDLMAEAEAGDQLPRVLALHLARIPKLLRHNGIVARPYDPAEDGPSPDPARWAVERHEGGAAPLTLSPLLLKGDKVLRAGRVALSDR